MNNKHIENIIRQIADLPNLTHEKAGQESVSTTILRIIYEEFRPVISNAFVLWDNNDDTLIAENEFYPNNFDFIPFFKDNIVQINKCIYPIKGKDAIVKYENYLKSHASIWHSLCALPIVSKSNNKKGVIILLSSHSDISLSVEQTDALHTVINETLSLYDVYNFIAQLSDFTYIKRSKKNLSNKYDILTKALKLHENHIKHFSIWKIDNINKDDFIVIREKNQNFKDIEDKAQPIFLLKNANNEDKGHGIIKYVNFLIEQGIRNEVIKKGDEEKVEDKKKKINLLKYIKQDEFTKEDMNSTEEYCKKIGVEIGKTEIIYIPIIPLRLKDGTDKINILRLYVNNRQQSIFNNLTVLSMLSRKIYESLTLHNQLIRNDTTKEILEKQDENNFFYEAAKILVNKNQCTGCYIYMKEKTDYFRMVIGIEKENENDEDEPKVIIEKELEKKEIPIADNKKIVLSLQPKVSNDEQFYEFFTKTIQGELSLIKDEKSYHLHYGDYPPKSNAVYSAILIPIREQKKEVVKENSNEKKGEEKEFVGFVLFTNKKVSNGDKAQLYSPYFSAHNETIVSPSIESIYRYKLLQDSIKNKDILLRKIRHEIPHEVNLINKQVKKINNYFIEQLYKDASDPKLIKEYLRKQQENSELPLLTKPDTDLMNEYFRKRSVTNQLALSNMRIELMANFATSAGFTTEEILRKRKKLNFITYINSVKEIFKEEARGKGIGIKFNELKENYEIKNVSRFYELAIHNIIFNAIRYSRFGTCVEVSMKPGIIEVINYGIGIKPEEDSKIYEENYRGDEATKFTEDGLGFGLYLARKVVNAHTGHSLGHESGEIYPFNYAGISSFCDFLDSKSNGLQLLNGFIKDKDLQVSWTDYTNFRSEMERLLLQAKSDYGFKQESIDGEVIANILKSEFSNENYRQITFDLFEKLFLKCKVHKTTFTIKFT